MSFKCLYSITIIIAVVNETTNATIITTTTTTAMETGKIKTSSVSPTGGGLSGGVNGKEIIILIAL